MRFDISLFHLIQTLARARSRTRISTVKQLFSVTIGDSTVSVFIFSDTYECNLSDIESAR
jgi:hypothetical protein